MPTLAGRVGGTNAGPASAGRRPAGTLRSRASVVAKARGSHQDTRSILIAVLVGMVLGALVFSVGYYVHQRAAAGSGAIVAAAGEDPRAKRIDTYWREGSNRFHYYYTDSPGGRMIDGGVMTAEDLLQKGIIVPGQTYPAAVSLGTVRHRDELAARFKAIRDHLN